MVRCRLTLVTLAAGLALAAPASAAERWAAPGADPANSTCLALSPCTLQTAIDGAVAAGSAEVVVTAGTYDLTAPLTIADGLSVHGESGAARPVLLGDPGLTATLVSADDAVQLTDLEIHARGASQHALKLKTGARGDRLVLTSDRGDGGKLTADPAGTMLTNSVVSTPADDEAALTLDGGTAGTVALRNVTVYAPQSTSTGVACETRAPAVASIVNSIVRGGLYDVDAIKSPGCVVDHSNVRAVRSPSAAPTNGVEADPVLDSRYRPLGGSNTIDQGVDDAQNGTKDLGTDPRIQGAATDMGAYEYATATGDPADPAPPLPPVEAPAPPAPPADDSGSGSGSGSGSSTPAPAPPAAPPAPPAPAGDAEADPAPAPPVPPAVVLPPAAPPQLGRSVLLDAAEGTVRVRVPGTKGFVALTDSSRLPVGTVIDTRRGAVTLSSALPGGKEQTGTFSAGLFTVRQRSRSGLVDVRLRGGSFAACPRAAGRRRGRTTARSAGRPKVVRRLWAKDKGGRFRTHGRNSVATVRGTRWLTEDRCDGTLTRVLSGAVDVRDKQRGTVTRVRAGRSLLVR